MRKISFLPLNHTRAHLRQQYAFRQHIRLHKDKSARYITTATIFHPQNSMLCHHGYASIVIPMHTALNRKHHCHKTAPLMKMGVASWVCRSMQANRVQRN